MHKLCDFGDCKVRNLNILLHIVLIVKLTYTISSNKKKLIGVTKIILLSPIKCFISLIYTQIF